MRVAPSPVASCRLHYVHTRYEPMSAYKTCCRVFLACRDERSPLNKSSSSRSSSTGSCASRDDTNYLVSLNSEDYRDNRCIARRLSSDDPNCTLFFLVRLYFFRPDGCSAGSLLVLVCFSEQASLLRLMFHLSIRSLLTTALRFSCIRRKALKHTAVYRLGESSLLLKCAVRGAHRSVLVVAHAAFLCC